MYSRNDENISNSEYDRELNPQQNKAVMHFCGPALVIAGPGTGKTRVLSCRIAQLIQNRNINSGNILAVTFTNKAAQEINDRLNAFLKESCKVCTFHSLGYSILKENIERTMRSKHFSIIDEEDKKYILLHKIGCEKSTVKGILQYITKIKQNFQSPEDIEDKNLSRIFNKYEHTLCSINAFDLDDLLYQAVKLFTDYPEILNYYRKKYQWIMIDEYQDINAIQYKLIHLLMPEGNSNLCVIGDPNQAIYGFRGADIKFIRQFTDTYPQASLYTLQQSHRCSENILKASGTIVKSKTLQGCMLQGIIKGVRIKLVENASDRSEAEFIARTIEHMTGGMGFFSIDSNVTQGSHQEEIQSLSDFVVLCRLKAQIPVLEKALNDHSIPYQTITDTPFFRQKPICYVIDLLQISINPQNDFLKDTLIKKKILVPSAFTKPSLNIKTSSVKDAVISIIDEFFSNEKEQYSSLFKKLIDLAGDYEDDLEEFLKFTSLGTGPDTYNPQSENVTLMTLHGAKGLEFKCVFIAGCENGLVPYSLFDDKKSDPDDEKRLLYVGMTRAKEYLYLCNARKRFLFSKEYHLQRSPFLDNIEEELTEQLKTEHKKKARKEDKQLNLF